MKKLGILIGAALALVLAGCGGGSGIIKSKVERWNVSEAGNTVDFAQGVILRCYTLVSPASPSKGDAVREALGQIRKLKYSKEDPPKAGDKDCDWWPKRVWDWTKYGGKYYYFRFEHYQTRNDTFVIVTSASSYNSYKGFNPRPIDRADLDKFIMLVAATLGQAKGFKYGAFDNVVEHVERSPEETTTEASGRSQRAGVRTNVGASTFGVSFGNSRNTTTTTTTSDEIDIQRKHVVRFYSTEPDLGGYFDLDLIKKSIAKSIGLPNIKAVNL